MKLTSVNGLSKDGVLSINITSYPFWWISNSKRPSPDPILLVEWLVIALGGSWCGPSDQKLVYRNSESYPKFEVKMR